MAAAAVTRRVSARAACNLTSNGYPGSPPAAPLPLAERVHPWAALEESRPAHKPGGTELAPRGDRGSSARPGRRAPGAAEASRTRSITSHSRAIAAWDLEPTGAEKPLEVPDASYGRFSSVSATCAGGATRHVDRRERADAVARLEIGVDDRPSGHARATRRPGRGRAAFHPAAGRSAHSEKPATPTGRTKSTAAPPRARRAPTARRHAERRQPRARAPADESDPGQRAPARLRQAGSRNRPGRRAEARSPPRARAAARRRAKSPREDDGPAGEANGERQEARSPAGLGERRRLRQPREQLGAAA